MVLLLELQLFNACSDVVHLDCMYELLWWQSTGAVLLIMALCQYYCGEKSCCWLLFADDVVEKMDAQAIEELYGLTSDIKNKS